jgi:hypothetical protein
MRISIKTAAVACLLAMAPAYADSFNDAGAITGLGFVNWSNSEYIKIEHTVSPVVTGACGTYMYQDVTFLNLIAADPSRNAINISLLQKALGNTSYHLFVRSVQCLGGSRFDGKYMHNLVEWQVRKIN